MSNLMTVTEDLRVTSCPRCGIIFGMPQHWYEKRRDLAEHWFCPAGHTIVAGQNEAERLRAELAKTERELNLVRSYHDAALHDVAREKRKRKAVENKLASQTERVTNGVCPCCNRTFQNLTRHMKTKHPELASQKKEPRVLP